MDNVHSTNGSITMTKPSIGYFASLAVAAVGLTAFLLTRVSVDGAHWLRFAILAAGAAVAHVISVQTPRNQTYQTTLIFLLAAVLLLPAALLPLIAFVQQLIEWIVKRPRLRFSVFNTANHALDMLAAAGVASLILGDGARHANLRFALAGGAAALTLVLVNHALLAVMIKLTRGFSLGGTGLFSAQSMAVDLVPAVLGVALAAFWRWAPWLTPTAIAPLYLIQQSLLVTVVQKLQPEATTQIT